MRSLKLISTCALVLLLTAIGAASAMALPEFLPGAAGTTFTGTSGTVTFQAKESATISCASSTSTGKLTSKTAAEFTVALAKCKALGLASNSLGDAAEVILTKFTATLCYTNLSPLEAGVLFKVVEPVHTETPSTGLLLILAGEFVGAISPLTSSAVKEITLTQKGGIQTIDGCRNAFNELSKETLTTSIDGTSAIQTGVEVNKFTLTFSTAQSIDD